MVFNATEMSTRGKQGKNEVLFWRDKKKHHPVNIVSLQNH